MRWFYILMLLAIIISLFSALLPLIKPQGDDPKKTVKALTLRVGLSITLFLILVLFKSGLVHL